MDRTAIQILDKNDSLAYLRKQFQFSKNTLYFCGHSLGLMPKVVSNAMHEILHKQWGIDAVRAWNSADWINMPQRIGSKLAPLLGVAGDEVIVADSTSINLYKLLMGALLLNPKRQVVITEKDNFPTNLYVAQAVQKLLPQTRVIYCERHEIAKTIDQHTAIVMLTHVNYRDGAMFDMTRLTQVAHEHGALMLWDLSHSTGVMPIDLKACSVDLAVGCSYKYLNGGPGAPAYLYVVKHLQHLLSTPLAGWMGHKTPFALHEIYQSAEGMRKFLCGTPSIIAMACLDAALNIFNQTSMNEVRAKSVGLSGLLIQLMAKSCPDLQLVSPHDAALRGGHVAFTHPDAYAINQALQLEGVITDFRAPNLIRFGLASLYLRYADVQQAVEITSKILADKRYSQIQTGQQYFVT